MGIDGCGSTPNSFSTKDRRVLSIIIDGLRPDALTLATTPTFDKLMEKGLYSLESRTQLEKGTWSAQGWTTNFKGVRPSKHGYHSNAYEDWFSYGCNYKSFLWYAKDFGLKTCAAHNWMPLMTHLTEPDSTDKVRCKNDADAVSWLEYELENEDFDLYFWGNDDVDANGHATGFTPEFPAYMAAIEEKDG